MAVSSQDISAHTFLFMLVCIRTWIARVWSISGRVETVRNLQKSEEISNLSLLYFLGGMD
jgi:hypothetical protein